MGCLESFCAKGVKGIVLFILVCAALAAAVLAFGLVLTAFALVIVLLMVALIVNPAGVRAAARLAAEKIDDWVHLLEKFARSMKDILNTLSQAAAQAAGAAAADGQSNDAGRPGEQTQKSK